MIKLGYVQIEEVNSLIEQLAYSLLKEMRSPSSSKMYHYLHLNLPRIATALPFNLESKLEYPSDVCCFHSIVTACLNNTFACSYIDIFFFFYFL